MRSVPRKTARAKLVMTGLMLALIGAGTAIADERLLDRLLDIVSGTAGRSVPTDRAVAVPMVVENQYSPLLKKMLTAEVHFIRKVCHPNATQLAEIRHAGQVKIAALAEEYAAIQNRHPSSWPDPRQSLTEVFQKHIDDCMSPEAAQRYRKEIAARDAARREAGVAMATAMIDRKVYFSPEQYERVAQKIDETWKELWSRNLQAFLYDQYAPTPDSTVLRPLLNQPQQSLWNWSRAGSISFGWEQDLGLSTPWKEGVDLEELDEYPREPVE